MSERDWAHPLLSEMYNIVSAPDFEDEKAILREADIEVIGNCTLALDAEMKRMTAYGKMQTEDESAFGKNAWVYCKQHAKPHLTGWCSVGNQDKIGLGLLGQEKAKEALQKCRDWGLPISEGKNVVSTR